MNKHKLGLLLMVIMLTGCSLFGGGPAESAGATLPNPNVTTVHAPDAEEAARAFLDAWVEGAYSDMYAMLSPLTQEWISETEFIGEYQWFRTTTALARIEYEIIAALVNPEAAEVRFRVTYSSAAVGEFERENRLELTRNDDGWVVSWARPMLLPDLEEGYDLYLDIQTPTRANIYDRNGLALASETDIVALGVVPGQIGEGDSEGIMLSSLSRLLDVPSETIAETYEYALPDWYIPLGEVSYEDYLRESDVLLGTGGVSPTVYSGRYYYGGGIAAHAVGYISQITQEELEVYQALGYQGDEYVGQIGLEAVYEDELRGTPGGTLYLINERGETVRVIAARDIALPMAIYTTIDRDLQENVQQAIQGFNGAIVVLERDTGAVLAMASSEGFDPHAFDISNPNWQYLLPDIVNDFNQPLVNRATNGTYPLGSVFKIITMAAALESGYYDANTVYTCTGEFTELPGQVFYDWTVEKELPPHGEVTLVEGLMHSCNPYFYHIGLDLYNRGLTTALPEMAIGFGLGEATGIELGDEAGIVPDPEWKLENLGEEWGPGDAVQLAIGQASLNVTPLQVARFVAAVGNGGTLFQPQIVLRMQNAEGEVLDEFVPIEQGTLPVSPENLAIIQQAMTMVVSEQGGTAWREFLGLNLNIAGKTGTAQSGLEDPHAWFAGYSFEEREDLPDIAVVVIVEYQGEGSEWAAPIFRRVMESYFYDRPIAIYPWESRIGVLKTATPTPEAGEAPEETPEP